MNTNTNALASTIARNARPTVGIGSSMQPDWAAPKRVSSARLPRSLRQSRARLAPIERSTIQALPIFAVDDLPRLTELYATILHAAGYKTVRTFNHRGEALAALRTDRHPPSLLVSNYLGLSMPVNEFLKACRLARPSLRILMASGFAPSEMRFGEVEPDCFLQKPFTPQQFEQAVKAALAADPV